MALSAPATEQPDPTLFGAAPAVQPAGPKRRGRKPKVIPTGVYKSASLTASIKTATKSTCVLCPDCAGELLEDIACGMMVCRRCQTAVDTIISHNQEFSGGGNNDGVVEQMRFGAPLDPLFPHTSLGTFIGRPARSTSAIATIKRLQTWNNIPPQERSLREVFNQIDKYTLNKGLSVKILGDAKYFYHMLYDNSITNTGHISAVATIHSKGICRRSLLAACVVRSCEKNGVSRPAENIAAMFEIEPSDLKTGLKTFTSHMQKKGIDIEFANQSIEIFVRQITNALPTVNAAAADYICRLAVRVESKGIIHNNNIRSIAAGITWVVIQIHGLKIPLAHLAKRAGISNMTIKDSAAKIYAQLRYVLPWFEYYRYCLSKLADECLDDGDRTRLLELVALLPAIELD
jgi:transcription initiation factor TFIIB